jgi:5-methylcytosine-specific restriction endonuclease McrA
LRARNELWKAKNGAWITAYRKQHRAQNIDSIKEYLKNYRAANVEKANAYAAKYRAENAERMKQWRVENAAYLARLDREYHKANPEKIRAKARRRRVMERSAEGSHTIAEWRALVKRFHGRCVCCRKFFGLKNLSEDHVRPLSRGGSDYIENIQPLCVPCNCAKGNRHATDYR